jgi:hypothetical protein
VSDLLSKEFFSELFNSAVFIWLILLMLVVLLLLLLLMLLLLFMLVFIFLFKLLFELNNVLFIYFFKYDKSFWVCSINDSILILLLGKL